MRADLGALIAVVLRHAPTELFPTTAVRALHRAGTTIVEPPAVGFECRLSGDDRRVDLGLCTAPNEALPSCVDSIFYEWDQLTDRDLRGRPLLFYRFGGGIRVDEALAATEAITGCAPPRSTVQLLAGMPASTRVTDYGSLDARENGLARIGVIADVATIRALLDASAWQTSRDALVALLDELELDGDLLRFQVDIGDRPTLVGLELLASQKPREAHTWRPLLEQLQRHNLCDARSVSAVIGWPSLGAIAFPGIGWCTLVRTISHLKVSRDAAGRLHAKAYLFGALTPFLSQ